ncbi:TIGR02206 family membrane protein [Tamlana sp. 2201CG12-4]|uniref:YwaF family protein n=1 Tax=Tamlana sp. 2201CG12-4 TaxID=3112582 RepID=UPI002DB63786|nr:TIGR02206 family membrane protein [Tamlana sp. 2201CG12-4]MEC3906963.1 TIGR02206 family membrane protein [Tamlana sp. 2201CG12-4]
MGLLRFNAIFLWDGVKIGTPEHLFPVAFTVFFAILFITYANRKFNKNQQDYALQFFSCIISLSVVVFHAQKISSGNYSVSTDLPLYLCSFLGLIIPLFAFFKKYWMYEILLFWIIGGTLQGVLTPDIPIGFPSFDYFRYWIVHLGLLVVIFYATFVFNMRPKLKSVFKSFFALQLYVILMIGVNYLLNANYFYLNEKPQSASLLDYFGDWPIYIIVVQIIIIPYFLLIYLPFYLSGRKRNFRNQIH